MYIAMFGISFCNKINKDDLCEIYSYALTKNDFLADLTFLVGEICK